MSRYILYRIAQWLSIGLSPTTCLRLAERLADRHCQRAHQDRAAVQSNLAAILRHTVPEDSPMIGEVFRHFARYLVEFLSAHHRYSTFTIEGTDALVRTMQTSQGGIVLSAHIGNWELGGIAIHRLGFPFTVVVLPHRDSRVNQFFDQQRLRCEVGVIPLGPHAAARCLRLLRSHQWLGILGDREFGQEGLAVPFFGRSSQVPRGPAILSLRTRAPVIPVFFIREGDWRFRFYVEPPIYPPNGPWQEAHVKHLTQAYVHVIEQYIRQFPTQWLMFQPIPETPQAALAQHGRRSEPLTLTTS